jgi:ribosome biogenesis GTPase / thiamine phosphate phosphatase
MEFEGGTRLIDTPGVRSFRLWKLTPEELKWYFAEFEVATCKFRDCSHSHEPGCGVREAARTGEIHPARYDTYLRLLAGDE